MNPFDELKLKTKEKDDGLFDDIREKLPINEGDLLETAIELEKDTGKTYTIQNLEEKLSQMVEKGYIEREDTIFGYRYKNKQINK